MRWSIILLLAVIGSVANAQAVWNSRSYSRAYAFNGCGCPMHQSLRAQFHAMDRAAAVQMAQPASYTLTAASSPDGQYKTETRYRTETYTEMVKTGCNRGVCTFRPVTRTRQVAYTVKVPITAGESQWVPSSENVVKEMLGLVQPKPGDRVYDMGCGDARVLEEAITKYDAVGVGIELDPQTFQKAIERLRSVDPKKYKLLRGDVADYSLANADVVTVYLFDEVINEIQWDTLKPGAKVVSHGHDIPGLDTEERSCEIDGTEHTFFVYEHQQAPPEFVFSEPSVPMFW